MAVGLGCSNMKVPSRAPESKLIVIKIGGRLAFNALGCVVGMQVTGLCITIIRYFAILKNRPFRYM